MSSTRRSKPPTLYPMAVLVKIDRIVAKHRQTAQGKPDRPNNCAAGYRARWWLMTAQFKPGDLVQKNPKTWMANFADPFGRGRGVGRVIEPKSHLYENEVDVQW